MRILLIAIGLSLAIGAHADHSIVTIKNAHKVYVKTGVSEKKIMGMVHCLLSLKQYDTSEKATEAAMEKIDKYCDMLKIDEDKCTKKKRKVAHHIHNCYVKADFVRDYFKTKAE